MISVSFEELVSLRDCINDSSSDLYLCFDGFCLMTDVGYALDGIDFFIKILAIKYDDEEIPF